ncbi:MAG: protein translocase subunit SecD [Chthoniobacteraceae bacterium]
MKLIETLTDSKATFIYGMALLLLFATYVITGSERAKRILGTLLSVCIAAIAIVYLTPPFDIPEKDAKTGQTVIDPATGKEKVKKGKIPLGIDLKGGTTFNIRIQPAEDVSTGEKRPITQQAVDQAVEVLRSRVDKMGTSEPVITPAGADRIMVQIPGLATEELDEVRKQLQEVAKLDFRVVDPESDSKLMAIEAKKGIVDPAWTILSFSKKDNPTEADRRLLVHRVPDITGDHIKYAYAALDLEGWHINIEFDKEAGNKFFELTRAMRVGQDRFAVVLDGKILMAPTTQVQGGIAGGSCRITGKYTEKEARDFASKLMNPLQNPVKIEEERSASASLGQDAISSGKLAGLLGLGLISVVMIFYYRLSGLFGNIGLMLTILVIFGSMALLHAVLTLPGIAGIILTLGMAVDAHVLVFERLREEMAAGKSFKVAVDHAFDRAFTAIFDANVTTLISAFILFLLATGPVKGFAVALTIGVIASLFSALIVSRTLYAWAIEKFGLERIKMMAIVQGTKINFLGYRKRAMTLSLAIIAISMGYFAYRGDRNYGIDFKGGDLIVLEATGTKPDDGHVRDVCEKLGLKDVVVQSEKGANGSDYVSVRSEKETGLKVKAALFEKFPEAKFKVSQEETVGSLVGNELKKSSALALGLGMLGIFLFVTLRFEFSFAVAAIFALLHDVIITIGAFALFGRELSLVTVGAILTIGGYSINDTIVVFDRIRETVKSGRPGSLHEIMNLSVNEMLGRTILTSASTLIPTIGLFAFGGPVLRDFAFAILVGVLTGTYSSVFIAAPIVLWWSKRGGRDLRSELKRGNQTVIPA